MLKHELKGFPRFSRYLWLTLGAFVGFSAAFVAYVYAEQQVNQTAELREQSLLLADELRQSSDDLTRMVRSYVITGDQRFKKYYLEILFIRDGKVPRPQKYQDVYWDLVLSDDRRPRPPSQTVSLLERMRQAGFTSQEFIKLEQAKFNSDQLTETEFAAMALIDNAVSITPEKRLQAARLLNDASYLQAKAKIMRPIADFNGMVDKRTRNHIKSAKQTATTARFLFVCFGVLLLYALCLTYRTLHTMLGSSVDDIHRLIAKLGSGDFSTAISIPDGMERSILTGLSQTQHNLARIDRERKHALQELTEAKIAAESASRAKSEFLSSMSHELQTPLNAILADVQQLKINHELHEEALVHVTDIERAGRWLLSLVNDLIDLSLIEADKLTLHQELVPLKGVLKDSLDTVRQLAEQWHVKLHEDFGIDERLTVCADHARLRQVIVNLVSHSIKYNRQDGLVTLSFVDTGEHVRLSVQDTGRGISPVKQQRLFKAFEHLERGACLPEGTEVGLMLSKRLIDMLGGRINFERREGEGCTFWIELPKSKALDLFNQQDDAERKRCCHRQEPVLPLLLVEDNVVNQMVVADMLDMLGYTVDIANNGRKAVQAVAEKQYGAVLMDCNIPEVDGYEATKMIRQMEAETRRHTPIIAVTACVMEGARERCLAAGMDDYLSKPIEFIRLKSLLELWRRAGAAKR